MKKLLMFLPLSLILCFMVDCQDKTAMTELEEFKAPSSPPKIHTLMCNTLLKLTLLKGIW
jgi:hypothetical protein